MDRDRKHIEHLEAFGLRLPPRNHSGNAYVLGMPPKFGPSQRKAELTHLGSRYHVFDALPSDGKAKGLVVLVHGIGDFSIRFARMAPALAAAGFRVVMFDFVGRGWGHGKSPYTLDSHVAELTAVVAAATAIEPAAALDLHIIAHSMGGCVATTFAARNPAQLKSLVLMCPAGAMVPGPLNCSSYGYSFLQCCCGTLLGCCFVPLVGHITNKKYTAKGFVGGGVGGPGGANPDLVLEPRQIAYGPALAAWDVAWIEASRRRHGNTATVASAVNLPLMDVLGAAKKDAAVDLDAVRGRQLPVLLLQAADDLVVKAIRHDVYRELFGAGGNVTFETRPGGHNFFIQDGTRVATRLVEFLEKAGGGGGAAAGEDKVMVAVR